MNPDVMFIKLNFAKDQGWLQNQNMCFTNNGKKKVFSNIQ